MSDIYSRIRQRREELGLSQEALAQKMGYKSKSSINKIELGKNDISQSKVAAFAVALNTTTAYLMGDGDAKEKNREVMRIGDRIRRRRDELGITQTALADAIGVSKQTLYKYENGIISNIPSDKIEAAAEILRTTPSFLMGWSDSPLIPKGFQPLPEMVQVPLIGSIACGSPILAEQNIKSYIGVPAAWRADFALECHGNSMFPKIQEGDIVCIRKQPEVETGQIAAVRIGEEATLKHFYQTGETVTLLAENAAVCPPMVYTGQQLEEITIEGLAVGFCRGLV